MPQFVPVHGKWGRVILTGSSGPREIVECTDVEAEVAIEQIEVNQGGGYWRSSVPGQIGGTGNMTIQKANSEFEKLLMAYISLTPAEMRARRDAGQVLQQTFTLEMVVDDPNAIRGYESLTLKECRFWNLPLGYGRGGIVQRRYNFTFEGIAPSSYMGTTPPATV